MGGQPVELAAVPGLGEHVGDDRVVLSHLLDDVDDRVGEGGSLRGELQV